MMKVSLVLSCLITSSFALAAAPTAQPAANADAQISAMLMAANDAEIKAGEIAEKKASNAKVKAFAKHMVEEHRANDKQAATLDKELNVKPQPNDKVAEMKKESEQKLADIERRAGKDFDKAYMELQVSMHEQVLNQIETALVPMTQNPAMKSFLETTKTHVEQHLAQAKKIDSSLK